MLSVCMCVNMGTCESVFMSNLCICKSVFVSISVHVCSGWYVHVYAHSVYMSTPGYMCVFGIVGMCVHVGL